MVAFQNYSRPRKARKSRKPSVAESFQKKAKGTKRPEMSAADALKFDRYSIDNINRVMMALEEGGRCDGTCVPYEDVFTFARWKALGCFVKKGEHGVKIPVVVPVTKESDDPDGESESFKLKRTTTVFCSCQVEGDYVVDLKGGKE
jgi:hypothetical protein